MPDVSGASWRFAGSSPLPRPREQDRKSVAFIPLERFGNDVAGCELPLGTCHCNRRGHGLEYIVAQHEMVKESFSCMAHGQARERPCTKLIHAAIKKSMSAFEE